MRLEPKLAAGLLRLVLRPVIYFCLRHALRVQDIAEISKALFVEIAREQLSDGEAKATDAAISVMTGLHRRDVTRLKEGNIDPDKEHNVIRKVIGHWQSDKRFTNKDGRPRLLSFGSEQSEFSRLVYSISNDITPASVLRELKRIGAIEEKNDSLRLMQYTYCPKGNSESGFRILSDDISNLILSVEQNVLELKDIPNMHCSTVYDRIDPQAIPQIQNWLLECGRDLHLAAREYLSQFDLDINPKRHRQDNTRRVVISSFSLVS